MLLRPEGGNPQSFSFPSETLTRQNQHKKVSPFPAFNEPLGIFGITKQHPLSYSEYEMGNCYAFFLEDCKKQKHMAAQVFHIK